MISRASRGIVASLLVNTAVAVLCPQLARAATQPEPGPADGGLRMRLVVVPRTDVNNEGFNVRVDLLNTSEHAITLRGGWENEEAGDVKDYIDAATSIECVPAVRRWIGGVPQGRRKSPQPEYVLQPGGILSAHWQTQGRHLKNRVTNQNDVQNPEFPYSGLYSVHATLRVITDAGTVLLRSNEQLVPVGGSQVMPKSTLGRLLDVAADGKTAAVNLGALQKIKVGDRFQFFSKSEQGNLTITTVKPTYSIGNLELLFPTDSTPPRRGTEVTLITKE